MSSFKPKFLCNHKNFETLIVCCLRGQVSVSDLCRREGIPAVTYYKWSKDFLEAGKNGLTLDTKRDASSEEVKSLREQNDALRRAVTEQVLEVQRLKKSLGL